jgi:hypothetical protein
MFGAREKTENFWMKGGLVLMKTKSTEDFHGEVKMAAQRGLLCSQIIVDIGLRRLGMRSQCLVKGAGGLVGAMGLQDATCGALTGAACLIAFAAIEKLGQGVYLIIEELESRFSELVSKYPGNTCGEILDYDPTKVPTEVCPPIIAGALQIALELLEDAGISATTDTREDEKAA